MPNQHTIADNTAVLFRRQQVQDAVLVKHRPITEVADSLGVHRQTVYRDLSWLRARGLAQLDSAIDDHRSRQLTELAAMAQEAWSQYNAIRDSNRSLALKWQSHLLDVMKRRADLLGLDAVQQSKIAVHSDGDGELMVVLDS